MMNGYTKNEERTFKELSISTVEELLIDYFTGKGYRIKFFRNRIINELPTGNLVYVEWDEKKEEIPEKKISMKIEPIKVIEPTESIKIISPIKVIEPIKKSEKKIIPVSNNTAFTTIIQTTKIPWLKGKVNKTIRAE
jgi:hypothetical protein